MIEQQLRAKDNEQIKKGMRMYRYDQKIII